MDLLRLDGTNYAPNKLIQGYTSLIWTERYTNAGEFELHTPRIQETLELLPQNSLISHRQTKEVMIVDYADILPASEGGWELVLKGFSYEKFLENRIVNSGKYGWPNGRFKTKQTYTLANVAALAIWNHVVDNDPVVTGGTDFTGATPLSPDPYDILSNVVVTNSSTGGSTAKRWMAVGDVYENLLSYLFKGDLGIRMIRPYDGSSGDKVSFNSSGVVTLTADPDIDKMRFDIYSGVDQSTDVVFDYNAGYVNDPKYLFSKRSLKNFIFVDAEHGAIVANTVASSTSGLARRVLYQEMPNEPDYDPLDPGDYVDALNDWGTQELRRHLETKLFEGSISTVNPYVYKTDYDLGDLVTLAGDYGIRETRRVLEFTRTEDKEGDRGYPTLGEV